MKDQLEDLERMGADVIFGRAKGIGAAIFRGILWILSLIFKQLVKYRVRRWTNKCGKSQYFGVQVISIGNLTMGGTGKTPVVELLSKQLRDAGRIVAILSRGYKSTSLKKPQRWVDDQGRVYPREDMPKVVSAGDELLLDSKYAGDEPYMLAKNVKGVSVLVGKYRLKSAKFAISQLGCDTLLLDDGMQYLNLAHTYDVVLIDSKAPFGTEYLIPRGTLREPPEHLKRASYILITKCDGSSNQALIDRIRRYNPVAEIVECTHGPIHLKNVFTDEIQPLEALKDRSVAPISAIAVPENFEQSLVKLGAEVVFSKRFSDHYSFSEKDVKSHLDRCLLRNVDWVVTTEKDAVRFPWIENPEVPIYFLRIEVKILKGQEVWDKMVRQFSHVVPVFEPILRNVENYDF